MIAKAQITLYENGRGEILIDGEKLTGVTGFTMTHKAMDRPHLAVDFAVFETSYFGVVDLHVADRARETLLKFGWTPPASDAS